MPSVQFNKMVRQRCATPFTRYCLLRSVRDRRLCFTNHKLVTRSRFKNRLFLQSVIQDKTTNHKDSLCYSERAIQQHSPSTVRHLVRFCLLPPVIDRRLRLINHKIVTRSRVKKRILQSVIQRNISNHKPSPGLFNLLS
jgi:hypothetical protein